MVVSTLGGVFLTVGLFFTFVGLSAALLQVAGDGHGAALEPAKLRTAVRTSSASVRSSSSRHLRGYSRTFLEPRRASRPRQDRSVGQLTNEIRRLSTYKSPEKSFSPSNCKRSVNRTSNSRSSVRNLAVAIGREITQALGDRFATISTDVADSVGTKVTEEFFSPVCKQLEKVGEAISQTGGQIASGAGDVLTAWKNSMEGPILAFGEQMQSIVGALQGLPATVGRLEAGLGSQLGSATNDLSGAVERLMKAFEVQQHSMMAAVADFNSKVAGIPGIVASASQASVDLIGNSVAESLGKVSRITDAMGKSVAKKFGAEVAGIAGALTLAAQSLKDASNSASTTIAGAGGNLERGIREGLKAVQDASHPSGEELKSRVKFWPL